MLAFPQLGEPFIVEEDESDHAVQGVLSQKGKDGFLHSVAYYSLALNLTQEDRSPHTKETFALLLACRHWYVYLVGTKFLLNSDHNPLVQLRKQKVHGENLQGGFPNLKNLTILCSIYLE